MTTSPDKLRTEVASRRTFAIISHPDAGKTTLTETILLYGGQVHLAGAVKNRGKGPAVTSDWMELERARGISITTSVLQFDYKGRRVNLLDTPGHNDFSEDTFRTLAAADAAVMLIDGSKGVEPQTIKLFEVCRMRHIPIVTFVNKLDRHGRHGIELMDEIERVLGIPCSPANWPIGWGPSFQGVYDRWAKKAFLFERVVGGALRVPMSEMELDDPRVEAAIGADAYRHLHDEVHLFEHAGNEFDREMFMQGLVTPVFFGSAWTNFGVEPFLDHFVDLAPPPHDRPSSSGVVAADSTDFSGFVFKVQANMDPRHRDRIAFFRICSGKFVRGMDVKHVRTGKTLTLNRPLVFMAQERTTIDEAWSGDIIGLWDPGVLRIGDTLCDGTEREFEGIPRFSPAHFVRVRLIDAEKRKQLKRGLDHLSEEGAVQLFFDRQRLEREPILGAVGVLQFEVIQYRLKAEYGVTVAFDRLPYQFARWIEGENLDLDQFELSGRCACVHDVEQRPLVLCDSEWILRSVMQDFPDVKFVAAVQPGRSARSQV